MAPASELPHIDLSVLTERQRDVIEMHYCSGLSFFAIGEFLCIKKSTVQEHHDRAISKLLDAMSYGADYRVEDSFSEAVA